MVLDVEIINGLGYGFGLGGLDKLLVWKDLKRELFCYGILFGIFVVVRIFMLLMKRVVVNFRWGVNFLNDGSL